MLPLLLRHIALCTHVSQCRGGAFLFTFHVTPSYPHEPPKVKCKTKVYHPNIDLEGNVCLNILREDWKPVLNINTIIYGLNHLFVVRLSPTRCVCASFELLASSCPALCHPFGALPLCQNCDIAANMTVAGHNWDQHHPSRLSLPGRWLCHHMSTPALPYFDIVRITLKHAATRKL